MAKKIVKNGYRIGLESRISTLEANYNNLVEKVDEIRNWQTNHFEHFKDDIAVSMNTLETRLCKKVDDLRGVPPWVTVMFTFGSALLTGLTVWFLTH